MTKDERRIFWLSSFVFRLQKQHIPMKYQKFYPAMPMKFPLVSRTISRSPMIASRLIGP